MNHLTGIIAAIESSVHVSLVDVAAPAGRFTAMLLETPDTAPHLKVGNRVSVMFKETEVSLAKNLSGQISLRNRIPGCVRSIRRGDILCEVVLDCSGQAVTSIITTRAAQGLELAEGDAVEALVKANEVSLAEADEGMHNEP